MFGPMLIIWVCLIGWFVFPAIWIHPTVQTRQERQVAAAVLAVAWVFTYLVAGVISLFTDGLILALWTLGTLLLFITTDIWAVRARVHSIRARKALEDPIWTPEDIAFIQSLRGTQ